MATAPSEIRTGLTLVTAAAVAEVQQVAAEYATAPQEQATALFAATPLIIGSYLDGSAALALDWYEELRDEAPVRSLFTPEPVTNLRQPEIGNAVAWATKIIRDLETEILEEIEAATAKMLADLEPVIQKEVAAGYWDTITTNLERDPDGVGWQRFTRGPAACPFCRMLADKGAVYKADTARFAAHNNCFCIARPVFQDGLGPEATAIQYVASSQRRSAADKARLRAYLKANYDA